MDNLFDKKPLNGMAGLKAHWKDDLLSGFMVSLIALPLCLGIAIASGVPPMAGLIAAIIGGMFMSRITGSHITISGPAAGLIVVILGAVESLGKGDPLMGYKYALAAIVVAGIIQVGFGLLRVGKLGDFFPSAAVHGMLAAIGIIIMVKQLFVALGTKAESKELLEVIGEIPHAIANMNPEIALIAMVSLFILVGHPRVKFKPIKMIPAPMWVIIVSIPMAHLFDLFHEHHYNLVGIDYVLGPKYLVHLPENIMDGIVFPDFGMTGTGVFWVAVISIALVASIESLLSASAVDTLDPYKRKSNLNRDMSAMGGGSAISGFLGGLPMISEIVRSSANISNGGKTQWANFFHGGFLLLFLFFGGPIIEQIPLAALAAMLIHVGFRLASPSEFKHVLDIGKAQLVIFITTIVTVLATDLIIGIAAGIAMKFIIHIYRGAPLKYLFRSHFNYEDEPNSNKGIIHMRDSAIFSNYLSLKKEIGNHHDKDHLVLDFKDVILIDHTFRTHLNELKAEWTSEGKSFELINLDHLQPASDHPLASLTMARNGNSGGHVKLTSHQIGLLEVAHYDRWNFDGLKSKDVQKFEGFTFNISGQMNYVHNTISGHMNGCEFIYAEIAHNSTVDTKSTDTIFPAVVMNPESKLPIFTLEKEGFFDKLADWSGFGDIDFDSHPNFSKKFLLRGVDEKGIRKFFTPKRLKLIEDHPIYHVESNGKGLIIYRFDHKLKSDKVADLLEFSKAFMG